MRLLTRLDLLPAAEVLTDAFSVDPLWTALYPRQQARRSVQKAFFRGLVAQAVARQVAYGVGEPIVGVSICERSGEAPTPTPSWVFRHWSNLVFSTFVLKAPRAWPVFRSFAEMRRSAVPAKHVHLAAVGVRPSQQGRGFGRSLMEALLATSDREGLTTHTETVTPERVGFYRRYGFEVSETRGFPRLGLKTYSLTRPAQPPGASQQDS